MTAYSIIESVLKIDEKTHQTRRVKLSVIVDPEVRAERGGVRLQ